MRHMRHMRHMCIDINMTNNFSCKANGRVKSFNHYIY